jgi:hypothetical protein
MELKLLQNEKEFYIKHPRYKPWNILLRIYQFTQSELLELRTYIEIYDMARFQTAATYEFIEQYFRHEVDESDRIDWEDITTWTTNR